MKNLTFFIPIVLLIFGCSNKDNAISSNCDFVTTINAKQFHNSPSDQLIIQNLSIENSCLKLNLVLRAVMVKHRKLN